jgi:hypothetical protein
MKKIITLALFMLVGICIYAQKAKQKSIVGTWRLVEFADLDSASNTWVHRYGKNPKGYFIYTAAGYLSINVSNEQPIKISEEESKRFNVNFYDFFSTKAFAYFGTYTFEPEKGRVIHHVKGGTIPWYTDTEQPRQIQLKGDTAIIGDNTRTRRVLVRIDY